MSSSSSSQGKARAGRVNVRRPDVMERVQAEVERHYRSVIVDRVRAANGRLTIGNTTVLLAKEFGFCYGVERAIELAYAARKVFQEQEIYLIGEIIHNPEVNRQLREMNIKTIGDDQAGWENLGPDDVVIIPAFGTTLETQSRVEALGCQVIDTTCGDVLSVYKRVRQYAQATFTSIIHGKSYHEETKATASRAVGPDGPGHYLILLDLEQTDFVCHYIVHGGDRNEFLARFAGGAMSESFDPDRDLCKVGVANQTTMLKTETEEMQRRLQEAILTRDQGREENFQIFETICGATQERQDALHHLLRERLDLLLVVGGYNSSNTSQLVKIGGKHLPTFFIRSAECLRSLREIAHFDLGQKTEVTSYSDVLLGDSPVTIGITAGASCPNNLIEETILRVFGMRGVDRTAVEAA